MSNRYIIHTERGSIGVDWTKDGEALCITVKTLGGFKHAEMVVDENGEFQGMRIHDYPPNPELDVHINVDDIQLLITMLESARREAYNVQWRENNLVNIPQPMGATRK